MGGGWVLEVDIRSFFDELDHGHLRTFLDRRVRDGVIRRTIGKWLQAGVLEEGSLKHPVTGTPQGGVVSPVLANIYLHEVIDRWFEEEVKPRLGGRAVLIRYADDLVIAFAEEKDASEWKKCCRNDLRASVYNFIPKRLGLYASRGRETRKGRRGPRAPAPSPSSGSLTSGVRAAKATGWSSARRPRAASPGRCPESGSGVAAGGTSPLPGNSVNCREACVGTTPTTESRATIRL